MGADIYLILENFGITNMQREITKVRKWIKLDSRKEGSLFPLFLMAQSGTTPMKDALGIGMSGLMLEFRGGTFSYFEREGEFLEVAKKLVNRIEKEPEFVEEAIDKTYELMEEVFGLTDEIENCDLGKKSDLELLDYYSKYCQRLELARAYGWIAPALDLSGYLTQTLNGILKKYLKGTEGEISKYFNIMTSPEAYSQMMKQEIGLLNLAFYAKKDAQLKSLFAGKNDKAFLAGLEKTHPKYYTKLKAHHNEFCWLPCIYEGEPWNLEYFISVIAGILQNGPDPENELKKIGEKSKRNEELKQKAFRELKLTKSEAHLFAIAQKILHFKSERKDLYQKTYFQMRHLMEEFARRIGISVKQVRFLLPDELEHALFIKKADTKLLDERFRFSVAISKDNATIVYTGDEAKRILKEEVKREEINTEVLELIGQCANPGYAKGKVRQILKPSDMPKMLKGDILVANATNPDIVPAMKKAAAIITNTGGITCHAAIVSRELGIPCIVGTKIATDTLKDGMEVEVDATKGIVKILKGVKIND